MKAWTTIIAILAITLLASIALICGIDGAVFFSAVVAISGLGGYAIEGWRQHQKTKR